MNADRGANALAFQNTIFCCWWNIPQTPKLNAWMYMRPWFLVSMCIDVWFICMWYSIVTRENLSFRPGQSMWCSCWSVALPWLNIYLPWDKRRNKKLFCDSLKNMIFCIKPSLCRRDLPRLVVNEERWLDRSKTEPAFFCYDWICNKPLLYSYISFLLRLFKVTIMPFLWYSIWKKMPNHWAKSRHFSVFEGQEKIAIIFL